MARAVAGQSCAVLRGMASEPATLHNEQASLISPFPPLFLLLFCCSFSSSCSPLPSLTGSVRLSSLCHRPTSCHSFEQIAWPCRLSVHLLSFLHWDYLAVRLPPRPSPPYSKTRQSCSGKGNTRHKHRRRKGQARKTGQPGMPSSRTCSHCAFFSPACG